jgi:hypothetical protein
MLSGHGLAQRVARFLAHPAAPALFVFPTLVVGTWLALWLQPAPHSDWEYYWSAAGEPSRYERGGLGLWLLALPKAIGLSPLAAALGLNLVSAAAMAWIAWGMDGARVRAMWLLCMAYLLLIAPYLGIVQLDLLAATALGGGVWLASRDGGSNSPARLCLAMLLVIVGVSTKPQYALTLWAMLGMLAGPLWLLRRRVQRPVAIVLTVLLAGSILGFAVDSGLRVVSGRTEAIRTNSAVTLYGGLLVSHDGQGCGYWSVEAAKAARADRRKPLHRAVLDRLSAQPAKHWVSVIRCKLPEILRPPPYALYWLVESPNIRARIDADPRRESINSRYYRILDWERRFYNWLTLAILLAVTGTAIVSWYREQRLSALLPVAWIASFWAVHLVFEIQGRYFLGMYLLAPLFCMLVVTLLRRVRTAEMAT